MARTTLFDGERPRPKHPQKAQSARRVSRKPPRRRVPRRVRLMLTGAGTLTVVLLVVVACGVFYANSLNDRIGRTDVFGGLTGDRPKKHVEGTLNVLVIGSDHRAEGQDPGVDGKRSDALMLIHVPEDHKSAQLISIPRDTWVFIPRHKGNGGQRAKINAAFAWGGVPLTVKTVEKFTGVKLDHVLVVDFAGFERMTDAIGGVSVKVAQSVYDPRSKRTFREGWNHLDGAAALDYVRQRYNLPRGDLDRMRRQQVFLHALMKKATDTGMLENPSQLKEFLEAAADSLTADKEFSLLDTAFEFRSIRRDDLTFLTMPIQGFETKDGQNVVIPDRREKRSLFRAVAHDSLDKWLKEHPQKEPSIGR